MGSLSSTRNTENHTQTINRRGGHPILQQEENLKMENGIYRIKSEKDKGSLWLVSNDTDDDRDVFENRAREVRDEDGDRWLGIARPLDKLQDVEGYFLEADLERAS
jgi:hypothetical protein